VVQFDLARGDYVYTNVRNHGAYDGDTVWLDIDVGFHFWRMCLIGESGHPLSYRLLDIDAPELRPLVSRVSATASRDFLLDHLGPVRETGNVFIRTYLMVDEDNFGRCLAHLWMPDGTSINRLMIDSGHAVPYEH